MTERTLFASVELPFCQALLFEDWNASPGRFFAAYRTRGTFTAMLGIGVVDEFRTISGPVLLTPAALLGNTYDLGLRLADARDVAAEIDQGWPPLVIGIDAAAPARQDDWAAEFLDALQRRENLGKAPWRHSVRTAGAGDYAVQRLQCSVHGQLAASIVVTDAPLLPQQLQRVADIGDAPVSVAVALGNRLPRVASDELQQINAVSEQTLAMLVASARRLEAIQK
jgi:hypothetical protein